MNFFEAQDRARKQSGLLITLYVMAVLAIILTIYLVVVFAFAPDVVGWWDPGLFLTTSFGVGLVVGGASLIRSSMLRSGGGRAVAEMLGGRLVDPQRADNDERRLHNVVEEMALAAGTPVPAVYVLDQEMSLNAFAAGYSPEDAVVAVTRGALNVLTRDELQAVIAHEFSHIVNRDIRLNIRLTGLIFGILALGLGGRMLLRTALYSGGGRRDGRAVAGFMAIGLALFVAGYLGVFFGRIIQAAVSRQREYLADAAAVQFTRNPEAMASTLKKIGAGGSKLGNASAQEVAHFFFASGLSSIWSTHPPLVERIRRIEPAFDGDFSKVRLERVEAKEPRRERPKPHASIPDSMILAAGMAASAAPGTGLAAPRVDVAGPGSLGRVPEPLWEAAHEPFGAVAMVYALMLDRDARARELQMAELERLVSEPIAREVRRLQPLVDALPEEARLPLVDVAAPSLATLSSAQADKLASVLSGVARADSRLSLFEFALETTVRHRLASTHGRAGRGGRRSYAQVSQEARIVLAALAHAGTAQPETARSAYQAGLFELGEKQATSVLPACTSDDFRAALDALADARLEVKARVIQAAIRTASHDGIVMREEAKLMRAIAAALDLPAPTFLPRFDTPAPAENVAVS